MNGIGNIGVDGPGPELDLLPCAPHGWKPLLELRLLKVPFTPKRITLAQLRDEMPKTFGPGRVTVPILIVKQPGHDDVVLKDSFDIACWLDETFASPMGYSLFTCSSFGGSTSQTTIAPEVVAGRAFARFIEYWAGQHLAPSMSPCVMHTAYQVMPENEYSTESRKHYMDNHFAPAGSQPDPSAHRWFTYQQAVEWHEDSAWFEKQCKIVRKDLSLVHRILADRAERGSAGDFLMGDKPTHADFALFCWYPYAATNPRFVEQTWKHAEVSFVGRWLDAMFASGLVSPSEFMSVSN